jgi:hypothetical protein
LDASPLDAAVGFTMLLFTLPATHAAGEREPRHSGVISTRLLILSVSGPRTACSLRHAAAAAHARAAAACSSCAARARGTHKSAG